MTRKMSQGQPGEKSRKQLTTARRQDIADRKKKITKEGNSGRAEELTGPEGGLKKVGQTILHKRKIAEKYNTIINDGKKNGRSQTQSGECKGTARTKRQKNTRKKRDEQ